MLTPEILRKLAAMRTLPSPPEEPEPEETPDAASSFVEASQYAPEDLAFRRHDKMLPWRSVTKNLYYIPWEGRTKGSLSFVGVLKQAGDVSTSFKPTRHRLAIYSVPPTAIQMMDVTLPENLVLSERLTPPYRFHDTITGRKAIQHMLNL